MALYGERFILLVEDGTALPSNLQGLYEVRCTGDELGYEATMKVLKPLNEFKSGTKPKYTTWGTAAGTARPGRAIHP